MSQTIMGNGVVTSTTSGLFGRMLEALAAVRVRAARTRRAETSALAAMSNSDLADMGITRHDLSRLFDPHLAPEFQSRGALDRVAARARRVTIIRPPTERPAVVRSLEAVL